MDDYKLAIIFNGDNEANNIKNGDMLFLGDSKSDDLHVKCLLDLARKLYPDNQIFQMLNTKHFPTTIAYYLIKMGHIVFLNTTHYRDDLLLKYGKSGELLLPESLNEAQVKSLEKLADLIHDNRIEVTSNMYVDNGFVAGKSFDVPMYEITTKEFIDMISKNCEFLNNPMK